MGIQWIFDNNWTKWILEASPEILKMIPVNPVLTRMPQNAAYEGCLRTEGFQKVPVLTTIPWRAFYEGCLRTG